jgi:7-carboxy-7-deazaguanine synthase
MASERPERLRITEIYPSVQGESTHVGKPCVFVRLTGCNLRCTWCDSEFTFTGGTWRPLSEVVAEATSFGLHTVEITGGEPLLQPAAIPLMARLLELGHEVLLETSGSLSIEKVPPAVHVILDLKAPGSGESERNRWENLALLRPHHEIKIVIASRQDYEWAREQILSRKLHEICTVLISPAWGLVALPDVAGWIVEDRLPVRFQVQLHKVVWDPAARGV